MNTSSLAPSDQQAMLIRYLRRRAALRIVGSALPAACAVFAVAHFVFEVTYAGRIAQALLIGSALLLYLLSNSRCPHCNQLFTVGASDWITHAFTRSCRHCGLHLNDHGAALVDRPPVAQ
jgi:hypothetical protein